MIQFLLSIRDVSECFVMRQSLQGTRTTKAFRRAVIVPATNANLRFAFCKIKSDIFNAIARDLSTVGARVMATPIQNSAFFCKRFRKHSS